MPDISEPQLSYPKQAIVWHRYAKIIVGNPLKIEAQALMAFGYDAYQNTAANGNTFTHYVYLAGGSYTLRVHGVTAASCAKVDWYLDKLKVVSLQDWYSAVTTYNVIQTAAVTVVGGGLHTLKGVVNGKNGASTGYRFILTSISLV